MLNEVESREDKNEKPRVRFCHDCGNKLYGNHHTVVKYKGVDHDFIYHKECARKVAGDKEKESKQIAK